MTSVLFHPLSFYVEKIERGEPFSSLLFGDGEFMVASGKYVGKALSNYHEVVTERFVEEMQASFNTDSVVNEILRGSDPHILNPESYQGRDIDYVRSCHDHAVKWINKVQEWVDGTVWDVAVREGKLAPLLKALRKRDVVIVGNSRVINLLFLNPVQKHDIPNNNAWATVDVLERRILEDSPKVHDGVFVICAGLTSVPLIMRLRKQHPLATFLDLGSVLDVFAKIGDERGWRRDMYKDDAAWRDCVSRNLEGVI
jgi:hypothetical protein